MKLRNKAPNVVAVDPRARRMFLKSAAGTTLSLPMLGSLLSAYSEKAMASSSPPLRYVHIYTPNGGLQHKNWFGTNLPTTAVNLYSNHSARVGQLSSLAGNNGLSPVLNSAFNNLLPYSNIIAGVDQPMYFGHGRGVQFGTFALCHPGAEVPYDSPMFNSSTLDIETESIDQVLAYAGGNGIYQTAPGARRRSMNMGSGSTSWSRDLYGSSGPVTAHSHLSEGQLGGAFAYLFGSAPVSGSSGNPILNLVNAFWPSGKKLLNSLSIDDRYTLERFFQLAQDVSETYVAPPANLNITKPAAAVNTGAMTVANYNALADMISLAFQADTTRIITLRLESSDLGIDWHGSSHNSLGDDSYQTSLITLHENIATNFVARLGQNLLAQDSLNSGSSVLTNSLIYWTHEHKAPHHQYSTPTLLMGQAGGRLATNQFIDLRKSKNPADALSTDSVGDPIIQGDLHNRLFASIFYAMNIPRSAYEIARGGTSMTYPLTKGYGHALVSPTPGWEAYPTYDLSRIGEPWEMLVKSGISWG